MRALINFSDEDVQWLDRRAAEEGKSRAALVREAVSAYRAESRNNGIDRAFGIWKDRTDIGDAVEWQRRERAGWTRPWDHDYDEVRAEFPDLFSPEEDREREYWKAIEQKRREESRG